MGTPSQFTAMLIRTSIQTYAGYAASLLAERHPETIARFGDAGFSLWKDNIAACMDDLTGALETDRASLFVKRVTWTRDAFTIRDVPADDLKHSLEALRDVLSEHLPPASRTTPCDCIDQAISALDQPPAPEPSLNPADPAQLLAMRYLEALLSGERRRANDIIADSVNNPFRIKQLYLDVLIPAQTEIGRMWHADEIGIAEEHYATAATQSVIATLANAEQPKRWNGKNVVLALAEGNAHDMVLRVLASLFEQEGWRAFMLGADLPIPDLADGVRIFGADLIVLSASMPTQLRAVRVAISAMRAVAPDVKILVGGRAFDREPNMWEQVGADLGAGGVDDALKQAAYLVGLEAPD